MLDENLKSTSSDSQPGGDCFIAAFQHLLKETDDHSSPDLFALVHGNIAHLPQEFEVNHAWVEQGDVVHEVSNGQDYRFSKDKFYSHFQITNLRRYTADDALTNNCRSGHYGPWP